MYSWARNEWSLKLQYILHIMILISLNFMRLEDFTVTKSDTIVLGYQKVLSFLHFNKAESVAWISVLYH